MLASAECEEYYSTASLAGSYEEEIVEDTPSQFRAISLAAPRGVARNARRRSSGASTPPPALAVDTAKVHGSKHRIV